MNEYLCDSCGSAVMDDGDCLCTIDGYAQTLSGWGSLADFLD